MFFSNLPIALFQIVSNSLYLDESPRPLSLSQLAHPIPLNLYSSFDCDWSAFQYLSRWDRNVQLFQKLLHIFLLSRPRRPLHSQWIWWYKRRQHMQRGPPWPVYHSDGSMYNLFRGTLNRLETSSHQHKSRLAGQIYEVFSPEYSVFSWFRSSGTTRVLPTQLSFRKFQIMWPRSTIGKQRKQTKVYPSVETTKLNFSRLIYRNSRSIEFGVWGWWLMGRLQG